MYTLKIEQMNCPACVAKINRALADFDPQAQISIDLKAAQISIQSDETEAEMCTLLNGMGYPATPLA